MISYSTIIKGFANNKLLGKGFTYIKKMISNIEEKYDPLLSYYLESANDKEYC